jgi:hypothetical protein
MALKLFELFQTTFGDELAKQYGLNEMPCKTFLLLIGIEAAKLAYVRVAFPLLIRPLFIFGSPRRARTSNFRRI